MCARALFPDAPTAPAGDSPARGSGPQPASSFPVGKPATAPAGPLPLPALAGSGPGGPESEATPREAEDVPQEEAARPGATAEEPAATAAPSATAETPSAEPAAEEVAVTAEAAAPEVAEVLSSDPQPVRVEEPEVVHGRRLHPKPVKVPLYRLMAKGQWAMEEIEEGFRQEWEELEAERHQLSDWEHRLWERIESVTSRYAEERAHLEQERDDLQE
jgi:hypothetical protein